jgi:hypothetical protein
MVPTEWSKGLGPKYGLPIPGSWSVARSSSGPDHEAIGPDRCCGKAIFISSSFAAE